MNVIAPIRPADMATGTFSADDIGRALRALDIAPGSVLMMHSSLFRLGRINDVAILDYPAVVVDAVRHHLSAEGTLVSPAPNWDYGTGEPFDITCSPVSKALGVLSAYVAGLPGHCRSANPIFSVAAVGRYADTICNTKNANAFGQKSPWQAMFDLDADTLCLGTDFEFLTLIRYIETRFGVPYLHYKYFDVPLLDDGQRLDWPVVAPLRYTHLPFLYETSRFEDLCRQRGILRETPLGGGTVMAVRMHDCFEVGIEALSQDIHFFLAAPPDYSADQIPRV